MRKEEGRYMRVCQLGKVNEKAKRNCLHDSKFGGIRPDKVFFRIDTAAIDTTRIQKSGWN